MSVIDSELRRALRRRNRSLAVEISESSAPSGAPDTVIIFAEDDGTGKTRLMARFPTGVPVQIAIEP